MQNRRVWNLASLIRVQVIHYTPMPKKTRVHVNLANFFFFLNYQIEYRAISFGLSSWQILRKKCF